MPDERCLVLFARTPVPGRVKTRLIPVLGEAGATALYRSLLERQLALVAGYEGAVPQLWIDGDDDEGLFTDFPGSVHGQEGADLGERMHLALTKALASSRHAVLIGCDAPGITPAYLDQAFAALAGGCEVVLGPARDGGYVLIGMQQSQPALFRDIAWGTAGVMAQTRRVLAAMGWSWRELDIQQDIDGPDDLASLEELGIELPGG